MRFVGLILLVGVAIAGCLEMSPAQVAAAGQTAQCERFVGRIKKGLESGEPCVGALAAAKKENPLCDLDLKCPSFDGGVGEGGL